MSKRLPTSHLGFGPGGTLPSLAGDLTQRCATYKTQSTKQDVNMVSERFIVRRDMTEQAPRGKAKYSK